MPGMLDIPDSQQSYSSVSQASNASDAPLTLKATNTGAGVLNTPLAAVTITETSGQTYGIGEKDDERYMRLRDESLRWLVGTMPVDQFMHTFLGGDRVDMSRMPPADNMFNKFLEENETGKEEEEEEEEEEKEKEKEKRKGKGKGKGKEKEKRKGKEKEKKKQWPRKEKDIQTVIISAMHQAFNLTDGGMTTRCPGFTFCDTSGYSDNLDSDNNFGAVKPDICLYADAHLPYIKSGIKKPEDKYSDMGFSALHFEVKSSPRADFFLDIAASKTFKGPRAKFAWIVDRGNGAISVTRFNHARHDLGQSVAYATEGCKRQHRRHYFTVSVSGPQIRFIRWDRSGGVASEAFNLMVHPDLFCQFFWRFAHITDAERGYDLTVEPATEEQEETFRRTIEEHVIAQLEGDPQASDQSAVKTALEEHYQRNAVTVIHLPCSPLFDDPDMEGHHLLVSRPLAVPLSVVGRSTRTYWAVDSRTGKVVLLKDTWRYDTIRVHPELGTQRAEREGDILQAMQGLVANIPGVVHQEDVPDFTIEADWMIHYDRDHAQTTQTQDYVEADWACGAAHRTHVIVKRIHYRLVLDVAGYTLLRLRGTAELLHGARDAFRALQDAYSNWKRFHGDITPGHIILYKVPGEPERKGYLVDWDISRAAGDGEGYLQDFQVSNTWQFLSEHACNHNWEDEPLRRHTVRDDMESILYVVLYCGVMYLPHKASPKSFRLLLMRMFDAYSLSPEGVPQGGDGKRVNKHNRKFTSRIKWTSPPFKAWLDSVMDLHQLDTNWNPVAVGNWWDEFLVQHGKTLPRDDRQNNITLAGAEVARPGWEAPGHVANKPKESTRTSPQSLPGELNPSAQKRNLDAADLAGTNEDDGTVRPQKQQRMSVNEVWAAGSPLSEHSASGSELRAWRDDPLWMSASSTPTVREGSYDSSAWTDGGHSTNPQPYGPDAAIPVQLTAMLRQLAARRYEEDETETAEDSDGSET